MDRPLQVELWSDVAGPFCWLGKRRFELALDSFEHADEVRVAWKSFQLDPSTRTDPAIRSHERVAKKYGIPPEQARKNHERLAAAGRAVGLSYDFDRIVVANTFDAHRLLQLAGAKGKHDEAEERLFRAYFSEGKNVDDRATLLELGVEIGLDPETTAAALAGSAYADAVRADITEASELGITGVPFYVVDRTWAISGAQEPDTFLQALRDIWQQREESSS